MFSASSSSRYHDAPEVPFCHCNSPKRVRWSIKNPGRRFYNCPLSLTPRNCNFFDWYDPPLTKYYKDLILKLKGEVDGEAVAEAKARVSQLKYKLEMLKEKYVQELATMKEKYEAVNIRSKESSPSVIFPQSLFSPSKSSVNPSPQSSNKMDIRTCGSLNVVSRKNA
ncbi:hypothetical protein LXL04_021431 [Taraxacum kok-saghyz]